MGQPPTGIGPGAVGPYNPYAVNNNYTMAYGEDRDPYGAQMPYQIPYDTYNPNYPAIPGVANSFAPSFGGQNYMFYDQGGPQAQQHLTEDTRVGTEPDPSTPTIGAMSSYDQMRQTLGLTSAATQVMRENGWNPTARQFGAANNGGMGQQAPIGTARPTSQDNDDYGVSMDDQRQHAAFDPRTAQFRSLDHMQHRQSWVRDSANANPNGSRNADLMLDHLRSMDGGKADRVASRAQNVDRYLATLATPAEMRADEMSRER